MGGWPRRRPDRRRPVALRRRAGRRHGRWRRTASHAGHHARRIRELHRYFVSARRRYGDRLQRRHGALQDEGKDCRHRGPGRLHRQLVRGRNARARPPRYQLAARSRRQEGELQFARDSCSLHRSGSLRPARHRCREAFRSSARRTGGDDNDHGRCRSRHGDNEACPTDGPINVAGRTQAAPGGVYECA